MMDLWMFIPLTVTNIDNDRFWHTHLHLILFWLTSTHEGKKQWSTYLFIVDGLYNHIQTYTTIYNHMIQSYKYTTRSNNHTQPTHTHTQHTPFILILGILDSRLCHMGERQQALLEVVLGEESPQYAELLEDGRGFHGDPGNTWLIWFTWSYGLYR